jgi:hypothetical protein
MGTKTPRKLRLRSNNKEARPMSPFFKTALCASVLAVSACTTLAPTAASITTTRDGAAVSNCKAVGNVASVPPYVLPGDDLKQL